MTNPRLPVIYAVIEDGTNSLVTACESNKDAELNASAQHRMSETREYRVVAYPPPPESHPREYWKLLDPGESVAFGDYVWFPTYWVSAGGVQINHLASELAIPIRRRVSPPPTCETCPYYGNTQQYSGDWCSRHETHMSPSDYCSRHPQAQEANRG